MRIFAILVALLLPLHAGIAQEFETSARAAWVYDMTTGTVLMEKDADTALPPASMSKLMTLYMMFEALDQGRLTPETQLPVSTKARKMAGSTMFLDEQDRPRIDDLIKGIIVMSGNDACVVVAEGMAGTEEAFARQMTQRGVEIGLTNSHFTNASGWPDADHVMSARDLGILSVRLISQFPQYYTDFALREFPFDNRAPSNRFNRNPLLGLGIGADGLKTGHSQEAGYGLVGSAKQGDRRIVFVLMGLENERLRAEESERVVNWAFREFAMRDVMPQGSVVARAPVWLGSRASVGLTTAEGVRVLIPAGTTALPAAVAEFTGPVTAPVAKGQELGKLVVTLENGVESRTPLIAAEAVDEAGILGRVQGAALRLGQMGWQMLRPEKAAPAAPDTGTEAGS